MTKKEKFIASLKDWKTYVFVIVPFLALIGDLIAMITIVSIGNELNANTILLFYIVITVALVLPGIPKIIEYFKRKTKRATVLAIVSIIALVALVVALTFYLADLPKLIQMENDCKILHQEYLQVDPENAELDKQKWHDYWDAKNKLIELRLQHNIMLPSILLGYSLIMSFVSYFDKKNNETDTGDAPHQNNTTIV